MEKKAKKRILIDDHQCRVFLKAMRDFGYPKLTLEEVVKVAQQVSEGTHSPTNVIAVMVCNEIDKAESDRA